MFKVRKKQYLSMHVSIILVMYQTVLKLENGKRKDGSAFLFSHRRTTKERRISCRRIPFDMRRKYAHTTNETDSQFICTWVPKNVGSFSSQLHENRRLKCDEGFDIKWLDLENRMMKITTWLRLVVSHSILFSVERKALQ